jgi:hypothetical protein
MSLSPLTSRNRSSTPSASRGLVIAAVTIVFLALPLASHLHKALRTQHGDWLSIYNIAIHSVETGELWADKNEGVVRSQRYPPIARPMLMLLALPPKATSAVLSFVLFVGLYGWCAVRVSQYLLPPKSIARWGGAALSIVLVAPYIWADLTAGNLTSILLWSVTAAFVLAQRGQPGRAGLALSIGIMLKMIPAVCLAYFVFRRQWWVLAGAVAGVVFFGLMPSLVLFGPQKLWDYHGYWYREEFAKYSPLRTIDQPVECIYQNQAVVRTMVRLFTHTSAGHTRDPFYIQIASPPRRVLKAAYIGLMGASLMALLWFLWRRRRDASPGVSGACYALSVGAMLWLSPWVGSYYFSLAMWPAVAMLGVWLRGEVDTARQTRFALLALLIWIAAMPSLASQTLRAMGINMLATLVLLIAVAWSLRSRGAPALLCCSENDPAGAANAGDLGSGDAVGERLRH